MIVDAVIHAPHTKGGSDEHNYHAHIMFTGRQIDLETGYFAKIRSRDFNKENSRQTLNTWREYFATICNKYLEEASSLERVDHRSYKDQNTDLTPTCHEGPKFTQLRRRGIQTCLIIENDKTLKANQKKNKAKEIYNKLRRK